MKNSPVLALGLICVVLAASLVASLMVLNEKEQAIAQQQEIIDELEAKIDPLHTLVFHVSEKGEDYPYARLQNASDIYNQLLTLNNNTYEILLMPEYMGHQNETAEISWIAENFGGPQGIPIMLCAFGGGEGSTTNPIPMLTTQQISDTTAAANVQWIRIAEICSWYIEHQQTFPTDQVRELLEFAKSNNLKVFWTEWKNDYPDKNHETFNAIKNTIQGYEDIVWVSFSTNSGDLEPIDGFLKIKDEFIHVGASVQAFYWDTRGYDLMTMPPSLLLQHSLAAKGVGAEILQFEPYWYFWSDGEANSNLRLLLKTLT